MLLLPCHYYRVTTTVLLLPCYYYRVTTYCVTTTVLLLPCHYYRTTSTVLLLPCYYYRVTTTVLLLPCCHYRVTIPGGMQNMGTLACRTRNRQPCLLQALIYHLTEQRKAAMDMRQNGADPPKIMVVLSCPRKGVTLNKHKNVFGLDFAKQQ